MNDSPCITSSFKHGNYGALRTAVVRSGPRGGGSGGIGKVVAPGTATPVKSLLHWQLVALGAGVETPGASVMLCWHQPFGYA